MTSPYQVNQEIVDIFYVETTGLVQGDFTITLYKDGSTTAEAVTITEIGAGVYKYAFTPLSTDADYVAYIKYDDYIFTEIFPIRATVETASVEKIRKYVSNRLTIVGTDYTVYEDDDATPAYTGTLTNAERDET